jgi:RND superfamily putative drug exporter
VILVWVAGLVLVNVLAQSFGGEYSTDFSIPGSDFQKGLNLLQDRFPSEAGGTGDLVFENANGVTNPETQGRIEALFAEFRTLPDVVGIESPFEGRPGYVSKDGTIGRAVIKFGVEPQKLDKAEQKRFIAMVDKANAEDDGLQIEVGGGVAEEDPAFGNELIGLGAAVIILMIAFGSVIAMGLPVGAAIFGLGAGFAVIGILTRFAGFPEFAPQFAGMIGIGVGIDYSLLVITRYREGLHTGHNVEESIVIALTTSGRAVIFAGIVVAIAMLGLFAMGLPFVAAMGMAGAVVVLLAVLVALTLMPALLSLSGQRIDRWRVPFLHSTEGVDLNSGWFRLSQAIQKRPLLYFLGAAAILITLGSPVLAMRLGFTDAGNSPESTHVRRAYDLLVKGFGPGFNGPIIAAADVPANSRGALEALYQNVSILEGVVQASPPVFNEAGDTAVFTVIPTTSPQDPKTVDLVHRLRAEVHAAEAASPGLTVYIAGQTGAFVDIRDQITRRMPYLFGGVIGLSFLLLMVVFRSVLVAAKAAIMNLLSIASAYGVLVAIFQWGWLKGPMGIEEGPIEPFLPMMLFAILFGLSMDYEVFLISRIREEYLRSRDNATAVSHGLAATARVITAAAAIMVMVFLGFVLGDQRVIKEFGTGLATAIFVDATIVRLFLVPATMELLGDANWWMPKWLDRIVPHVNVDGPAQPVPAPGAIGGGN